MALWPKSLAQVHDASINQKQTNTIYECPRFNFENILFVIGMVQPGKAASAMTSYLLVLPKRLTSPSYEPAFRDARIKNSPTPKTLISKYKLRDNRWDRDREIQGKYSRLLSSSLNILDFL